MNCNYSDLTQMLNSSSSSPRDFNNFGNGSNNTSNMSFQHHNQLVTLAQKLANENRQFGHQQANTNRQNLNFDLSNLSFHNHHMQPLPTSSSVPQYKPPQRNNNKAYFDFMQSIQNLSNTKHTPLASNSNANYLNSYLNSINIISKKIVSCHTWNSIYMIIYNTR